MNCAKTSVGKPNDEVRGYLGLVDCIGKAAADRIAERVATYCGNQARSLSVVEKPVPKLLTLDVLLTGPM